MPARAKNKKCTKSINMLDLGQMCATFSTMVVVQLINNNYSNLTFSGNATTRISTSVGKLDSNSPICMK